MSNLHKELDKLEKPEVDDVAIRLMSTLGRNDLVHILLDMVEPKVMLENIITTKEEQEAMAVALRKVGSTVKELVCYECTAIYNKLELELTHHATPSTITST